MEGKVLIACLGNRNITYKDRHAEMYVREEAPEEYLIELPRGRDAVNFRKFTQWLWENYEAEKQHIGLEILNEAIIKQQEEDQLVAIVLFTTDQSDERAKYQDTLYEGYIMKELIKEHYGYEVQLFAYTANPTHEDEIVEQLKPNLLQVYQYYADSVFVYHDAGGTPQMKSVIKMLMNYQLPPGKFKISYSNQQGEFVDKQNLYQKRYQNLTIAREFVKKYNYEAAREVLNMIRKPAKVNKELREYVKLAFYRKNFMSERLLQVDFSHRSQLCQSFVNQQAPEGTIPFEDFDDKERHEIFEIASICQLFFLQEYFPLAVATFYRLLEDMFMIYASKKYPLKYKGQRDNFIYHEKNNIRYVYKDFDEPRYGLPFLVAYTSIYASGTLKSISELMIPHISYINGTEKGINQLRNNTFLAHGKKYVDKGMLNNECPLFLKQDLPKFFELLGMPETNIYDQMNEEIFHLFNQE